MKAKRKGLGGCMTELETFAKCAGDDLLEIQALRVKAFGMLMSEEAGKMTIGDYVRLVQLEREMAGGMKSREMVVRWVNTEIDPAERN
jgi:hypothetical protein